MLAILRLYLDVVLHQRGPEDVPASLALFTLTLAADAAVNLAVSGILDEPILRGLVHFAVSIVMLLSVLWLLLSSLGKGERWLQAASAVLGADIVLTGLQGLLFLIAGDSLTGDPSATPESQGVPLVYLPLFLLFAWQLAVLSFVVQRAANLSLLSGIGVAVAYFVLTSGLFSLLPM